MRDRKKQREAERERDREREARTLKSGEPRREACHSVEKAATIERHDIT